MVDVKESGAAFNVDELKALEAEAVAGIASDEAAAVDALPVAVDEEMRGLVGGVLGMGFAVLAPNWEVKPEEVEQLTEAYTALICKYFPDGLGEYGVEISAVMMTFAVVAPRIGKPRERPKEPAQNEEYPSELEGDIENGG